MDDFLLHASCCKVQLGECRCNIGFIMSFHRIHLALNAYKELLTYVAVMAKGKDENLVTVANVIQSAFLNS